MNIKLMITKIKTKKIKGAALLLVLTMLTAGALQTRALRIQAQSQEQTQSQSTFQPRPLVDATKVEIEKVAIDYTLTHTSVKGDLKVLLSGMVTPQQFAQLGLAIRRHESVNYPPMYLVLLEGDINPNGLPGLRPNPNLHAQYLVYVMNLTNGRTFYWGFSPSLEVSPFKVLITNPPTLADGPREGENDPNKLPYGSVAPPADPSKGFPDENN